MKYFSEISLQDSKFRVYFDENNGFLDGKFDQKMPNFYQKRLKIEKEANKNLKRKVCFLKIILKSSFLLKIMII